MSDGPLRPQTFSTERRGNADATEHFDVYRRTSVVGPCRRIGRAGRRYRAVSGAPYPIYALLAAVIVIDLSPSKTRQLALQRLIGTLLGGTVGAALSYVLPAGPLAIMISILAAMLLTYVARVPAAAKLSGYVCGIVILAHGTHPWSYALSRVVETFLGLAMAVLVSLVPKLLRVETADWGNREAE